MWAARGAVVFAVILRENNCAKYDVTWPGEAACEVLAHLWIENLIGEIVHAVCAAQIAELAPAIVVGEAVIASTLNVRRRQVSGAFTKRHFLSLHIASFQTNRTCAQ